MITSGGILLCNAIINATLSIVPYGSGVAVENKTQCAVYIISVQCTFSVQCTLVETTSAEEKLIAAPPPPPRFGGVWEG